MNGLSGQSIQSLDFNQSSILESSCSYLRTCMCHGFKPVAASGHVPVLVGTVRRVQVLVSIHCLLRFTPGRAAPSQADRGSMP